MKNKAVCLECGSKKIIVATKYDKEIGDIGIFIKCFKCGCSKTYYLKNLLADLEYDFKKMIQLTAR
jgi:hypothetical protein